MASVYSDNLDFSLEGLQAQIGVLEEVRNVISQLKNDFLGYNESNLKPYWATAGSVVAQSRLEGFIHNDIDSFIQYLDGRINDLKSALSDLHKIDEA